MKINSISKTLVKKRATRSIIRYQCRKRRRTTVYKMFKEVIIFVLVLIATSIFAAPTPETFTVKEELELDTFCESYSKFDIDENRIPNNITHIICADDCKERCPANYRCTQLVTVLEVKILDKTKEVDVKSGCACKKIPSKEGASKIVKVLSG